MDSTMLSSGTDVSVVGTHDSFAEVKHCGVHGLIHKDHLRIQALSNPRESCGGYPQALDSKVALQLPSSAQDDQSQEEALKLEPIKGADEKGSILLGWSSSAADWRAIDRKQLSRRCSPEQLMQPLKVMTQNVWFDPSNKEQRFLMLIELIEREAPHVVALQEMTPD